MLSIQCPVGLCLAGPRSARNDPSLNAVLAFRRVCGSVTRAAATYPMERFLPCQQPGRYVEGDSQGVKGLLAFKEEPECVTLAR